jgi:hypothetical protein
MYQFDHPRSVNVADDVLPIAERIDDRAILADTLVTKGTSLGASGRPREGLLLIRGASQIAAAIGRTDTELRARVNMSTFLALESPRDSWTSDREGVELARRVGYRPLELTMFSNSLSTGFQIGEWERAEAEAEGILSQELDPADRISIMQALLWIRASSGDERVAETVAEIHRLRREVDEDLSDLYEVWTEQVLALAAGRFDEAFSAFERGAASAGGITETPDSLGDTGRAALWAGNLPGAHSSLERLRDTGVHGRWIDAVGSVLGASIAAAEGRTAEALSMFRPAVRTLTELRVDFYEAMACLDMVRFIGPGQPEIDAAADRAREIFTRLRATPYLARIEETLARAGADNPRAATATTMESVPSA